MAPAWYCPYKRKAFLNIDFSFACNNSSKYHPAVNNNYCKDHWKWPRPASHSQTTNVWHAWTQWSLDKSDLLWPLTLHLSLGQVVGSLFYHASLMQSDGSQSSRGPVQARPKKWSTQSGWEKKNVKGWKGKKDGPSSQRLSASALMVCFRSVMGHHRLCCTCTCSRGQSEWPEEGRGRQPVGAGQIQQRFPQPAGRGAQIEHINFNVIWCIHCSYIARFVTSRLE